MAAFQNKVIIITGASEGIGRALAIELAPQMPKLVLAARNEDRLNELVDELEGVGAETLIVPTDVTSETSCRKLMDATVQRFGQIDILVNNAGGTMWSLFDEVEDISIFERVMNLNYLSGVYCTYHALPHLKKNKGLIVAVSSVAGMTGVPTRTGYAASKHAQFGFFDSLRIELQGSGVDVTMIAPDFVVTQIHKRALKGDGQPMKDSPLKEGKVMTARECALLIVAGIEQRKRLVIGSSRGKLGRVLKLIWPKKMDDIARKAISQGH
jgi:short-subunit dehydrogenase